MNDLISRQDAIDEINHIIPYRKLHNGVMTLLYEKTDVKNAIKRIESAEITGIWEKHIVKHRCPRDCWYPSGFEIEGTWNEEEGSELRWDKWFCSNCGKQYDWEHNYCPNCGARMINHE